MSIKNILVHQNDDQRSELRLGVTLDLARKHHSHLTALYVVTLPRLQGFIYSEVGKDILQLQAKRARAAAEEAHVACAERARLAGVPFEWRIVEGDDRAIVDLHARYADLIVVGQGEGNRDHTYGVYDLAEELVLTAGRPVLTIPYAGEFPTIGERVMVSWDGSHEATRAVHEALPLLKLAAQVVVLRINPPDSDHIAVTNICAHLARHGVTAEARSSVAKDIEVGDALLSAIADFSVDLVVMGAYGHSRLREMVLGGATRHMLRHMTAPVVMSH